MAENEHQGIADVVIPELTEVDDRLHPSTDDWWETETAWFSFSVPERRIGGWFYNQILPTQQVCNGGAWVWDDSAAPSLYERREQQLELPSIDDLDLRDVELPNGNHIKMIEPLSEYRVRYADPGAFEADLLFRGIMAPNSHPLRTVPFWRGRHFDQPMHVTGEIVLHGEMIEVDCISVRDRSWGPRPMGPDPRKKTTTKRASRPRRAREGVGYLFGSASHDDAWLMYSRPTVVEGVASDVLSTGYLLREGEYGHLVSGHRRFWLDAQTKWISRIEIEATDEHGRTLEASGELVSRHGEPGSASGSGLFHWTWNGLNGWGEDQTYAPPDILAALDLSDR